MFNFLENDILFVIIYHFIKNMKQKYATKYIKKNVTDANIEKTLNLANVR